MEKEKKKSVGEENDGWWHTLKHTHTPIWSTSNNSPISMAVYKNTANTI